MPWTESTCMSQRREFLALAAGQSVPLSELCRRFGISRKTGYKWLARDEVVDRSRRPHTSPRRTDPALEAQVLSLRQAHPVWGGRKIAARLRHLGYLAVPHPSTITHILRRHGQLEAPLPGEGARYHRFEHPVPNALWQMDFKGDFPLRERRCHPLTVLDDHARYSMALHACQGQSRAQVQPVLEAAFRHYGLPERINVDNGQPWGSPSAWHGVSALTVWLVRLGVRVSFSRPAHPQTNGKDERFHRTLKAEVLAGRVFADLDHAQRAFDHWRTVYNHERPHQALGMAVPASRYRPSPRPFPDTLPPIEYGDGDTVVTVKAHGVVRFRGQIWRVSKALRDLPIAIRPDPKIDGRFNLYFCHHRVALIDLTEGPGG
ncbi:IS481 family transposase [Dokdonella koreensis]|nr:IS481 family transposase [Dokdonella koreensis]